MPDDLTQRVIATVASAQRIPADQITIDSTFEQLGIDSMDAVNILFALESEFDITIPDDAAREIRNVRQAVEGVEKLISGDAGSPAVAS